MVVVVSKIVDDPFSVVGKNEVLSDETNPSGRDPTNSFMRKDILRSFRHFFPPKRWFFSF